MLGRVQKRKHVRLSSGQYTPEGRIVGDLHYGRILDVLLHRDEFSGYPHNGGEHTLYLYMNATDTEAFFELIEPIFAKNNREGFEVLRARALGTTTPPVTEPSPYLKGDELLELMQGSREAAAVPQ